MNYHDPFWFIQAKVLTSKDGTSIAFDQIGQGPALILVDGAMCYRASGPSGPLASLLAPHFTVYTYDRRGRGASGDTTPYAIEREVEDIEVLINEVGGSAFVYGISSGAALALEAAKRIPAIKKLALYEPPFIINDSRPPLPKDFIKQLKDAVAAGHRGDTIDIIMTQALQIPAQSLGPMRDDPMWPEMIKVAHTLVYDGLIQRDVMMGKPLPRDRWTSVNCPTLVLNGERCCWRIRTSGATFFCTPLL